MIWNSSPQRIKHLSPRELLIALDEAIYMPLIGTNMIRQSHINISNHTKKIPIFPTLLRRKLDMPDSGPSY